MEACRAAARAVIRLSMSRKAERPQFEPPSLIIGYDEQVSFGPADADADSETLRLFRACCIVQHMCFRFSNSMWLHVATKTNGEFYSAHCHLSRRNIEMSRGHYYANISLIFKNKRDNILEENEFNFFIAKAIQTVHGEIANEADILRFTPLDKQNYTAIIKFKAIHYTRIITSLLLYGEKDCKIEVLKIAPTPCLLSF